MKKLSTILTMVAAFCIIAVTATAQTVWEAGKRVPTAQIKDGMKVVIESASNEAALGSYLTYHVADDHSFQKSASVSPETVWTVISTGTTNADLDDAPEWILKNEETGKYLGYDEDVESYHAIMVDTPERARKLCFFGSTEPAPWGTEENPGATLVKEGYTPGWDESSTAIAISKTAFLANYWENNFVCFWEYWDTNAWNFYEAVEKNDNLSRLKQLLDSYGAGIETYYIVDTNPGCLTSEEAYNNFYDAYQNAVDAVQSESSTDAEYGALYDALVAAKAAADNPALQVPMSDGYYYIITANNRYSQNKAITYDNNAGNDLMWNTLAEDNLAYVWEIHKVDGGWSVQNVATGVFMDKAASTGASQAVKISREFTTPTVFEPLNCGGIMAVSSTTDWAADFPFHQNGHAGGAGASGNIVLWKDGAGSPSSWYVRRVSAEMEELIESGKGLTRLNDQLASGKKTLVGASKNIGEEVGKWNADGVAAFQAVVDEADALIADGGTNDAYLAMAEKVRVAYDELLTKRNRPEDGEYYQIVSSNPAFFNNQGVEKAMYISGNALGWKTLTEGDAQFYFKAIKNDDGSYFFQNPVGGVYIGRSSGTGASEAITSSQNGVNLRIDMFNDSVYDVMVWCPAVGIMYHTGGHGGGAGISGGLVNWNGEHHSGSSWYIRKVNKESVNAIVDSINLSKLVAKSEDALDAITVYEPDLSKPVVNRVGQLFSNNKETSEGSYDALIDGLTYYDADGTSVPPFFHSAWSNAAVVDSAYHYLRAEADGTLPEKFVITFTNRGSNGRNRPRVINVAVSNDAETWVDLGTVTHNVNRIEPDRSFVSPEFNAGGAYKYVKMTVLATTGSEPYGDFSGDLDKNGFPFFALCEFNVYPSNGVSPASQINDAVVKAESEKFSAALEAAKTTLASGKVTTADIETLQAALDAFMAVQKDTTLYTDKVAEVNILKENLKAGTEVGQVSAEAYATFESEIAEPANITPVYKLNRVQMEEAIAKMDAALAKVKTGMVMPDAKSWTFIKSAMAAEETSSNGWFVMSRGREPSQTMYNQLIDDPTEHVNNAWVLENDGNGKLYIHNVGTGLYQKASDVKAGQNVTNAAVQGAMPEAESFSLIALNDDQFAIKSNSANLYLYSNTTAGGNVTWKKPTEIDLTNTRFAFTFESVDVYSTEMYRPIDKFRKGTFRIMMLPTELSAAPADEADNELEVYEITGQVTNEGGNITAINLSKVTDANPVVKGGKPFILYAPGDYTANESTEAINLVTNVNSPVAVAADDSINGLVGLAVARTLNDAALATFANDSVKGVTASTTFGIQSGYINTSLITNIEGATNDLTVYVKGAGIVNSIEVIEVVENSATVNVYTIDGVLLKKNVARGAALNGLAKGIYIVGKSKVLVK